MTTQPPLKPAPQWVHTSGAGYHDSTGLVTASHVSDPASFVHGFEQGAYALATLLYPLVVSTDKAKYEQAFRLLRAYHDGLAHPVAGWEHEPKRN